MCTNLSQQSSRKPPMFSRTERVLAESPVALRESCSTEMKRIWPFCPRPTLQVLVPLQFPIGPLSGVKPIAERKRPPRRLLHETSRVCSVKPNAERTRRPRIPSVWTSCRCTGLPGVPRKAPLCPYQLRFRSTNSSVGISEHPHFSPRCEKLEWLGFGLDSYLGA